MSSVLWSNSPLELGKHRENIYNKEMIMDIFKDHKFRYYMGDGDSFAYCKVQNTTIEIIYSGSSIFGTMKTKLNNLCQRLDNGEYFLAVSKRPAKAIVIVKNGEIVNKKDWTYFIDGVNTDLNKIFAYSKTYDPNYIEIGNYSGAITLISCLEEFGYGFFTSMIPNANGIKLLMDLYCLRAKTSNVTPTAITKIKENIKEIKGLELDDINSLKSDRFTDAMDTFFKEKKKLKKKKEEDENEVTQSVEIVNPRELFGDNKYENYSLVEIITEQTIPKEPGIVTNDAVGVCFSFFENIIKNVIVKNGLFICEIRKEDHQTTKEEVQEKTGLPLENIKLVITSCDV
jgi:hypothetical protein